MNNQVTNAMGRDAFHRVPNLIAEEVWDVLERVPTGIIE